jgi:hypothetical protein
VEEVPSGERGLAPLADFGTVHFSGGSAVKDDQNVTIAAAGAEPITMTDANDQALAVPSSLGDDGASFSIVRTGVPSSAGQGRTLSPLPGRHRFGN